MIDKLRFLTVGAVLLVIGVFISCGAMRKTKRTVLFKGMDPYPWRVEYVRENKFPAISRQYYEVYYDGEKVVIPKEVLGSKRDVSQFVAAGGFDVGHTYADLVVVTIKFVPEDSTYNERVYATAFIRRNKLESRFEIASLPTVNIDK